MYHSACPPLPQLSVNPPTWSLTPNLSTLALFSHHPSLTPDTAWSPELFCISSSFGSVYWLMMFRLLHQNFIDSNCGELLLYWSANVATFTVTACLNLLCLYQVPPSLSSQISPPPLSLASNHIFLIYFHLRRPNFCDVLQRVVHLWPF